MIRNTARAMTGPLGGIAVDKRFQAIGFRCAKWPKPARDVLEHRLERLREDGLISDDMHFPRINSVGIEKRLAQIPGKSIAIGFASVRRLSNETIQTLGYLYWNADLSLVLDEDAEPIPADPNGYLVGLRKGEFLLFRPHPAPVVPIGRIAGVSLGAPIDGLVFPRATIGESGVRFRVPYRSGSRTRVLDLPLTFHGKDIPDKSWRR
jgi:hypothetical protein